MANPPDSPAAFADPAVFLNSIEWAERRKDSHLAVEYVLPLPHGISRDDRIEMARGFAWEYFVSKDVPVLITIHQQGVNWHAHLIRATRRVGPDGFSAYKALDLDPQIRTSNGRRFVAEAQLWGDAWTEFQERWFSDRGLKLRVDPVGIIPQEHVGPQRWNRRPDAPRIQRNQERRMLNARAQAELDRVDRRPLTLKDVARELSPEYADLVAKARVLLHKDIPTAAGLLEHHQAELEAADRAIANRWEQLGAARKGVHRIGVLINGSPGPTGRRRTRARPTILLDPELEAREKERNAALRGIERWTLKRSARQAELRVITRLGLKAFNAIRPEAQAKLEQRQRLARQAREFLDAHEDQHLTQKQQYQRGRSLSR
jgi:hypothetical protein